MIYEKPSASINIASQIRELANSYIIKELNAKGITDIVPAHGAVFFSLKEHGSMTMGQLAKLTNRKKNSLTSLVQTLEKNGYLTRQSSKTDARAQEVSLTDKGINYYHIQRAISDNLMAGFWENISDQQQEKFVEISNAIIANLKRLNGSDDL